MPWTMKGISMEILKVEAEIRRTETEIDVLRENRADLLARHLNLVDQKTSMLEAQRDQERHDRKFADPVTPDITGLLIKALGLPEPAATQLINFAKAKGEELRALWEASGRAW